MRKSLLQPVVADAAAGSDSPVVRGACAPDLSTPGTLPADGQQLQRVVAIETPPGEVGSERSADDDAGAAARVYGVEGEHRLCRDNFLDKSEQDTSPTASAADGRQADSSAGHRALGALAAAPETMTRISRMKRSSAQR